MTRPREAYLEDLKALRVIYAAELPAKVEAIAEAAAAALAKWDDAHLEVLYHLVHRLVGSAAIYGFAAVSQNTAALETFVIAAREGRQPPPARREAELRALLDAIKAAVESGKAHHATGERPPGR
jgi:chemotaxis protein histidine kinase CheA